MKKTAILVLTLAAMLCSQLSAAQGVLSRSGIENPDKWIVSVFAAGKVPPFSFAYEEISSAKFIEDWQFSRRKVSLPTKDVVEYICTWTDPSGTLRVSCDVKGFPASGAVEWVVSFKNISRHNSAKIAVIKAADYKVSEPAAAGFTARYSNGITGAREDCQLNEFDLRAGVVRDFTPDRGLSSAGSSLPYYNVISRGADAGVVMAIGWSGRWKAQLRGATSMEYKMFAGLEKANFYLRPGEEVRTPLVATVFWKGAEVSSGENALRRFVLAHHAPKVAGRLWAPSAGALDFGSPAPCSGSSCLSEDLAIGTAKRYKQLGLMPDVLVMSPGWETAAGDWRPKEDLFPDGFGRLSAGVHALGARLMVAMSPENVAKGTAMVKEHPEYLLVGERGGDYIYDFSQPKAVDYMCRYIGGLMEAGGLDGLVCNVSGDLGLYWDKADESDRQGIVEMKYVAGLYKFWDYILKRFPDCAMDNSSGGLRLDLEAVSRSAAITRGPYAKPEGTQCRQYGLNMYVPLQGALIIGSDPYSSRSCFGGLWCSAINLFSGGFSSAAVRAEKDAWLKVQKYLLKDYYPLSGTSPLLHDDIWLAAQFDDPGSGSGIVIAFRRSLAENITFAAGLKGIDPDAFYTLYDLDSRQSVRVAGAQLAKGYKLTLKEPRSSIILEYVKQ